MSVIGHTIPERQDNSKRKRAFVLFGNTSKPARFSCIPLLAICLVAQDDRWFQENDRGNRYEGTIDQPHARLNYELRGFFAYRQSFRLEDATAVKVRFYLPEKEDAFISCREILSESQYLMKPKPNSKSLNLRPGDWSEFSGWDVDTVLKPMQIDPDNLGIIVRLKSDSVTNEEIAPAIFVSSKAQLPGKIAEYTLYITADEKLRKVDYRVTGRGFDKTFHYTGSDNNHSVEAGTVMTITIPATMLQEGHFAVHIYGDYADRLNESLSAWFRFYHKPL